MDPNAVVLEISSDEETGWDAHDERVISGGFDDNNWIAELLDEVNGGGDCGYHNGSDDSDEVVLVSEVFPSRRHRKKPTSKSSSADDDCVVLDHDPGKPNDVRDDTPVARRENGDDDDDDSDDLLVVSETGQVACRDFPHPRHLCIKFPFSSSPNESHCDQCYCYVCDSLAPCLYWGNGSGAIDHCQATEKLEFWKLERQNSKNRIKFTGVQPLPNMNMISLPLPPPPVPAPPPPPVPPPLLIQTPIQRPNPTRPNLGAPNQNRVPFMLSRNKYQPGLVSQQLIRTSSCTIPRNKGHHNYSFNRPVFKRSVSPGIPSTGSRHFYSSHRGSDRRQQFVNNSCSFPPPFQFSPDSQPQLNSDSYVESPITFQPQLQSQSSLPNYSLPPEASLPGSHTVDPKFFHGINWPESQTNHLPAAQIATPASEPLVAADSGELVDYPYDNLGYEHQSMEIPVSFGLNELSPEYEPDFLDAGTMFDF